MKDGLRCITHRFFTPKMYLPFLFWVVWCYGSKIAPYYTGGGRRKGVRGGDRGGGYRWRRRVRDGDRGCDDKKGCKGWG